ncbi:MAG: efflux RND transporter periplasmic adaptor subunit [Prevotella sp.]|nr:efflux RND transporter periplasmic adaptor subunit [Prevotella sp.]
MKIQHRVATLLTAVAAVVCISCRHSHGDEDIHHESIQLTAYSDDFEVYAEAMPFVAGEQSEITAHFTHLKDFKPLETGKVTASLTVGGKTTQQTMDAPSRPGIFLFTLIPEAEGKGLLRFDIETEAGGTRVVMPEIEIFAKRQEALHDAAERAVTGSNAIAFPKEMSWKTDFSAVLCRKQPFGQVIRTMAQVQPSQGDERIISAKAGGIVTISGTGVAEGKAINAGQTLLYIENGNMADNNMAVRYREAESSHTLAKQTYERKRALAEDGIVSQSDLQRAKADYEAAEAAYNNLHKNFPTGRQVVTSPIGGFVSRLFVRNGEYVEAGQPVATISQNRTLRIKAEIQSRYYPLLGNIMDAHLRIPRSGETYDMESLNGRMVSYGKSVEADSPLLPVLFQVDNKAGLLPGEFVEMFIKTRGTQLAIVVPNVAIVEEMGNHFVFVQLTPELFEKREVRIGQTDGVDTEILSGLDGSERIVAKGAMMVKLAQATGFDAHGHSH